MRVQRVLPLVVGALQVATPLLAGSKPVTVSPGDPSKLVLVGDACPTFSWGEVDGARGYELVIYRLGEEGEEAQPVLRQRISGSALGWTPSLDRCLERSGRYAWSVRAVGSKKASKWSGPRLFQVASGPSAAEFEAALDVVRSYLDGGRGAVPGTEAPDPGQTQVESEHGASASSPVLAGVSTTQLTVEGGVVAGSFTGDGSALTGVTPDDLACAMPGCVDTSEILDGTILFADLAGNGCGSGSGLSWTGTTWACTPLVPVGSVLMFSGATAGNFDGTGLGIAGTQFEGWALCNGYNNTPNLGGRFVVGVGSAGGPTYSLNDTGGEDTHTLTVAEMPSHTHTGTANSDGEHNHRMGERGFQTDGSDAADGSLDDTTLRTHDAGSHTHSLSISSAGSGQAHENRPSYYALGYIMRVQ